MHRLNAPHEAKAQTIPGKQQPQQGDRRGVKHIRSDFRMISTPRPINPSDK